MGAMPCCEVCLAVLLLIQSAPAHPHSFASSVGWVGCAAAEPAHQAYLSVGQRRGHRCRLA